MKQFKKLLVVTDASYDEHRIVMAAADIAQQNSATLKIVDVVPHFSWAVRLTLPEHDHVRELIAQEKQEKLEALAAKVHQQGVEVETKVLHGTTSVEIIREVLRGDHDLVLRVAKGIESRIKGFFGSTGTRLLRQCPCAVLLATPDRTQFKNVLGCVDTSSDDIINAELNDKIFEYSKAISQYHGGRFTIVHAWSVWIEQMLKRRMSAESFATLEQGNYAHDAERFDTFLKTHGTNIEAENTHMIKGPTPEAISSFAHDNKVDLIVMGTVAKTGVSGLLTGNTAEQTLAHIRCSILALKPSGFACPIHLNDAEQGETRTGTRVTRSQDNF